MPDKISESIVNEYIRQENNPRFYFGMLGDMAVQESGFYSWIQDGITEDMREIATSVGVTDPLLWKMLQSAFLKWTLRGFYFGKRHEMVNWIPAMIETPLTERETEEKKQDTLSGWGEVDALDDGDFE